MKKILLLANASGEATDFAAKNLSEALHHLAPSGLHVETVDLLDSRSASFAELLSRTLSLKGAPAHLHRDLQDVLREQEPDVAVFTSPVYGHLLEEIHRSGRARDFAAIALATDPILEIDSWLRVKADLFVVTNQRAARALIEAGRPEEAIKIFGYPLRMPRPAQEREPAPPRPNELARILYLVNCARKRTPKLLDRLLAEGDWRVTVCLDEPGELEEVLRARAADASGRVKIEMRPGNLPRLLRQHHVVITRASTGVLQEAIAARCPVIVPKLSSRREEANLAWLQQAHAGALAEKPREVVAWLRRAFRDEGTLLELWRRNLDSLRQESDTLELARLVLSEAAKTDVSPTAPLRALPSPVPLNSEPGGERGAILGAHRRSPHPAKELLLCDLHAHTTWSDGKLTLREIVDFYGRRGFDCLCITDHLCDPGRLLGRLVNLTGLVIPPGEVDDYFTAIEREKKRAWAKYDLLLLTGLEFNKDGYTPKTSAHLLGIDLKKPIDPALGIEETIREIHAQGALAVASHPHETKSRWGKDTLYFWEHIEAFAPLLDAWEVANRDDIFNPIGLKKLPFIASSDFHKPKHIHSWKTLLYCEKEAEAIKHCVRVNRDVSLTLYRDHRFGLKEDNVVQRGYSA